MFRASPSALFIGAALAALPFSTVAEPWLCNFTVECDPTAGCASGGFTAQVIAADHADELFLSTAMGDSPVIRLTAPDSLPASYAGAGRAGTAELVTIEADRTAIMSVHLFDGDAAAITYFGTCEELT
ncbi:hypothetical protein [Roseicyclus sp.]|uniref:hypothetical protein n=1 Tax=Roseicyclus sp. TaxID=1914329 RepID=UPI003F6AD27F